MATSFDSTPYMASTAASARAELRRFVAQRASAVVLAFCVFAHLTMMIIAIHQGLSAAAILARTRGNVTLSAFYLVFVIAVSIHAPLGLRNIAAEWAEWRGRPLDLGCIAFGVLLLALGVRAIWAVCWSAA